MAKMTLKPTGAEIDLLVDHRQDASRRATLTDTDGLLVSVSRLRLFQSRSAFIADGPGYAMIPGELAKGKPTRATFRTALTYQEPLELMELTGGTRFDIGGELEGSADQMRIKLRMDSEDVARKRQLAVESIQLTGQRAYGTAADFAEVRVHPAPDPARPSLRSEERVGQTLWARAFEIGYDNRSERVRVMGAVRERPPQVVFQRVEAGAGGAPLRPSMRMMAVLKDGAEFSIRNPDQFRNLDAKILPSDRPMAYDDNAR
jgi:hypothetical protein